MKRIFSFLFTGLIFLVGNVWAEAPNLITYQGRLKENNLPVTDNRNIEIVFCTALTGGTCYPTPGTSLQSVTVSNGLFKSTVTVPSEVGLSAGPWYLAVYVGATELSPREQFTSVPYAVYATSASYVAFASSAAYASGAVQKTGDTMTGQLTISGSSITVTGAGAALAVGDKFQVSTMGVTGIGDISGVSLDTNSVLHAVANVTGITGKVAVFGDLRTSGSQAGSYMAAGNFEATAAGADSAEIFGGARATIRRESTGSGVIAKALGFMVDDIGLDDNAGTITDTYGVYIGSMTGGLNTQTNQPYAIYSMDPNARTYFAGNIGIGTASPSQKLEVAGTVKATSFEGNGSNLTGISGTDSSKVAKAGDTMNGDLTLSGSSLTLTSGSLAVGTSLLVSSGIMAVGDLAGVDIDTVAAISAVANLRAGDTGRLAVFGDARSAGSTAGSILMGGNFESTISGADPAEFAVGARGKIRREQTGSGAVTSVYTLMADDIQLESGAGTITNTYGVYIGSMTGNAGTQANAPYALYSMDPAARTYFAGNVGIGTTGPSYRLDVQGGELNVGNGGVRLSGAYAIKYLSPNLNLGFSSLVENLIFQAGADEKMRIDRTGRVGIGTTNPAYRLHVSTVAGEIGTVFAVSTGATNVFYVAGDGAHATYYYGDGSQLQNLPAAGGGLPTSGGTMTGDLTMANGSTITISGSAFSVGASTFVVKSGRIGIGTASPTDLVTLNNQGVDGDIMRLLVSAGGSFETGMRWEGPAGFSLAAIRAKDMGYSGGGVNYSGDLIFMTDPGVLDVSLVERMRINYLGNVGISTNTPQARLDIVAAGSSQTDMTQIWRDSGATIVSSMSATGVMMAGKFIGDGSGLTGVTASGGVAKAGDTMTGDLYMGNNSTITVTGKAFSVGGSTLVVNNGTVSMGAPTDQSSSNWIGGMLLELSGETKQKGWVSNLQVIDGTMTTTVGQTYMYGLDIKPYYNIQAYANWAEGLHVGMNKTGPSYAISAVGVSIDQPAFGTACSAGIGIGWGLANCPEGSNRKYGIIQGDSVAQYNYFVSSSGFGVELPTQQVDVAGNVNASGAFMTSGVARLDSTGALRNISSIVTTGNVGISTGAPQARLDVLAGGSGANDVAQMWRNSGGTIVSSMSATGRLSVSSVATTGSVGIGTTSPGSGLANLALLDAVGSGGQVNLRVKNSGTGHAFFIADKGLGGAAGGFAVNSAGTALWDFGAIDDNNFTIRDVINGRKAFKIEANAAANSIYVSTGGSVGLGTATPAYRLHVSSGAGEAGTIMAVSTGSTNLFYVAGDGAHATKYYGDGSGLIGVTASGGVLKVGDTMTGALAVVSSVTVINANSADAYSFAATTDPTKQAYHLYVATTGNVGIGTATPETRLTILAGAEGQVAPADAIRIVGPNSPMDANSAQNLRWAFNGAGSAQIRAYRDASWGTHFQFLTNALAQGSDSPQVRMHISENGNVGIGNTSPGSLLSLNQDIAGGSIDPMAEFYDPSLTDNYFLTLKFGKANSVNNAGILGFEQNPTASFVGLGVQGDNVLDGGVGLVVRKGGLVGVGRNNPEARLDVVSTSTLANTYAQIWRDSDGVARASVTATGKYYGDGSGLTGITANTAVNFTGSLAGDVTGTQGATVVGNDTHLHTGVTISGLAVANFASPNISSWTNDSGYITAATALLKNGDTMTGPLTLAGSTLTVTGSDGVYGVTVSSNIAFASSLFTANGRTGIGTVNPQAPLHVYMNSGYADVLRLSSNWVAPGTYAGLEFGDTYPVQIRGYSDDSTKHYLKIRTYDNGYYDSLTISGAGYVGISTGIPQARLDVLAAGLTDADYAQIWRASDGVVKASVTATGKYYGDGSGLTGVPGDNLGDHNATQNLQLNWNNIYTVSSITAVGDITAARYQINGSTVLAIKGNSSLLLGVDAGVANTGSGNTFVGKSAGWNNAAGEYNTFLGYYSGFKNTLGSNNSYLGGSVAYNNQTGSGNAIFGSLAGGYNDGGAGGSFSSSTVMGYKAGYKLTTGSADNILLGFQAGYYITSGAGNIVIGYNKDISAPGASNELNIGGVLYGDLSAKAIGISTRAPQAALDVVSTATAANVYAQIWRNGAGVEVASITSQGKYYGDGSGLTGIAASQVPASGVQAGTMGATVIVSSVGIGTVYESAIQSGAITDAKVSLTNPISQSKINGLASDLALKATDTLVVHLAGSESIAGAKTFASSLTVAANAFSVGGSTLVVDQGNIGIGTVSPKGKLHISTGSAGSYTPNANAADIIIENSGNAGLSIITPDSNLSSIVFGSPGDAFGALIRWDLTNRQFSFGSQNAGSSVKFLYGNGSEGLRIDSAGNVGVSTNAPSARLDIKAAGITSDDLAQIWRDSSGVVVGSMSATGVMKAIRYLGDGASLTGIIASQVPASGVQAGMLGVNVIASSIAINAVSDASIVSVAGTKIAGNISGNAANVTGIISLGNGGTGANLSATGGANQIVRQNSVGAAFTVSMLADADIPDTITLTNVTQITNRAITDMTGTLAVANGGTGATTAANARTALGAAPASEVNAHTVFIATATSRLDAYNAALSTGVYTANTYADPAWITSLSTSKISLSTVTTALGIKADDSSVVHLAGVESITGAKTFVANPVFNVNAIPQGTIIGLASDLVMKATDTLVVHLAGTENISGIKTITSSLTITANAFSVGGSTLVVDQGNIGIGTVSPKGKLHISTGSAGSYTPNANAADIIIENSGNAGLSIITPDSNLSSIVFGSPGDAFGALIRWDLTNRQFSFGSQNAGSSVKFLYGNGSEGLRIDSTGNVGVGTAAPAHKLSVSGDVLATSSITAQGGFYGDGSGLTGVVSTSAVSKAGDTMTGQLTISGSSLTVSGAAAMMSVGEQLFVSSMGYTNVGDIYGTTLDTGAALNVRVDLSNVAGEDGRTGIFVMTNTSADVPGKYIAAANFEPRAQAAHSLYYLIGARTSLWREGAGSGTLNAAIGVMVDDLQNLGGTITDTYGIYIGDQTNGTQTNTAYALYSADSGARTYFAGNVGIGTSSPSAPLTVSSAAATSDKMLVISTGTTEIFSVKGNGEVYTAGMYIGNGSGLTNVTGTDGAKVAKTGDTMTGALTMSASSITVNADTAAQEYALLTNGLYISTSGAIVTMGLGNGSVAPNTRNRGAVDLQTYRNAADQVAAGDYATLSGGIMNKAAGKNSVVGGGTSNAATADNSYIGGGSGNQVTQTEGAIAGGMANSVSGQYGFLGGGYSNKVTGTHSAVAGGWYNEAGTMDSFVGSGKSNIASGSYSFIGSGSTNTASGIASSVVGGESNTAFAQYSVVAGGSYNMVTGSGSVVGGGLYNIVSGTSAVVAGGEYNEAPGIQSFIGGGRNNYAWMEGSMIGGGDSNKTNGSYAVVSGGQSNEARNYGAVVSGGLMNYANGDFAAIPGGLMNYAGGRYAFAAGALSSSTADGAFTWADSQEFPIENTAVNRTLFKNAGGFMITGSTVTGGSKLPVNQAMIDVISSGTAANVYAQVWRDSDGVSRASVTATGKFYGDGSGLSGVTGTDSTKVAKTGDTMTGQLTIGSTLTVTGNGFSVGGGTLAVYGGKVGVGTAYPSYDLSVVNSAGTGALGISGQIVAGNTTGRIYFDQAIIESGVGNPMDQGYIAFQTKASGSGIEERVRISSTGLMGIGTANPEQRLTVAGNISQTGLLFSSGTGSNYFAGSVGIGEPSPAGMFQVGGGTFTVTIDGKVGIGTKYPSNDLTIQNTSGLAVLSITGSAGANSLIEKIDFPNAGAIAIGNGASAMDTYMAFSTRRTGFGVIERVRISSEGAVGIRTTDPGAALDVVSTGTASNIYAQIWRDNTGLAVATMTSTSVLSLSTVTLSGKLGIGTDSPTTNLDVRGASSGIMAMATTPSGTAFFQADSGNTGTAGITLLNAGAKKWGIMNNSAGTNVLSIYDYPASANRLVIDSTGSVGIGTTGPAAKLDVVSTGTLADQYAQIWRDSTSLIVSSVSATGVMAANKFVGKMGAGAGQATMIGLAGTNLTTKGTTSLVEEVLLTYTLPANSLSANGKGVRITAWGTTAATSNIKTIRIRFGGLTGAPLVFNDVMTTPNNLKWKYEAVVFRTGPSAQKAIGTAMIGNQVQSVSAVTTAQTESAPIDIALTGYTPTTPGDITAEGLMVEFIN